MELLLSFAVLLFAGVLFSSLAQRPVLSAAVLFPVAQGGALTFSGTRDHRGLIVGG